MKTRRTIYRLSPRSSLMKLLVKQLAIPLSNQKTVAKWLVIAIRLGYQPKNFWPGTRKTIAESLVMKDRQNPLAGFSSTPTVKPPKQPHHAHQTRKNCSGCCGGSKHTSKIGLPTNSASISNSCNARQSLRPAASLKPSCPNCCPTR